MSINKRIFGTPITGSVRTKLEARQASGSFNTVFGAEAWMQLNEKPNLWGINKRT